MKLINTDSLVLIGPGSEWFWTAVSGMILAITFLAIYRQLRLQRSQGAVAQIEAANREWYSSERYIRHRLDVYVAIQGGADPLHLPDGPAGGIAYYWEGVGALVRGGYLDKKLLWASFGGNCQHWWAVLASYAHVVRARDRDPQTFENFEWLAGALDAMDRRVGVSGQYGDPVTPDTLAGMIASARDQLRMAEALRTVIIAPPQAVPPAPLAAGAAADG